MVVVTPSNAKSNCDALSASVQALQNSLRARSIERSALLERFWAIQDNLHRLLASCDDESREALAALAENQGLITKVLEVLKVAPRTNPAISETCKNIDELLIRLDFFRQKSLAEPFQ